MGVAVEADPTADRVVPREVITEALQIDPHRIDLLLTDRLQTEINQPTTEHLQIVQEINRALIAVIIILVRELKTVPPIKALQT